MPDQPVYVFAYRPESYTPSSPILITLHGYKRNAETYRDDWVEHAESLGALLLAPEFNQHGVSPGTARLRGRQHAHPRPPLSTCRGSAGATAWWSACSTGPAICCRLHPRSGYWLYGHLRRRSVRPPPGAVPGGRPVRGGHCRQRRRLHPGPAGRALPLRASTASRSLERRAGAGSAPATSVVMVGENETAMPTNAMLLRSEEAMRQGPAPSCPRRVFLRGRRGPRPSRHDAPVPLAVGQRPRGRPLQPRHGPGGGGLAGGQSSPERLQPMWSRRMIQARRLSGRTAVSLQPAPSIRAARTTSATKRKIRLMPLLRAKPARVWRMAADHAGHAASAPPWPMKAGGVAESLSPRHAAQWFDP